MLWRLIGLDRMEPCDRVGGCCSGIHQGVSLLEDVVDALHLNLF